MLNNHFILEELKMKKTTILSLFCMFMPNVVFGAAGLENPEAIAVCGASKGHGYYFSDGWQKDGVSEGQIILFRDSVSNEFDILFGNNVQNLNGYRQDDANVILLYADDDIIRIGAFHDNYTDIYSFSKNQGVVAWSSNKSGPIVPKAAVYVADCE